ncbi:MAG: Jag N-terminal domain-containing protein [Selenomonadaceae bacterium]|nr:Jag N-terminal domain-containing protein [Selenomonadaceae bacterium]
MAIVIEKTGKTVEEAIQAAVDELGVDADKIDVEVLERPAKRLFGWLGETPAKIRATLKETVAVEKSEPVEKKLPVAENSAGVEEIAPVVEKSSVDEKSSVVEETAPVEEIIEPILAPSPADENSDVEALDKAKIFLHDVFKAMNLNLEIDVNETDDGYLFDLRGKGLGVLIGRHGQALDSLQYLLNLAANRRDSDEKIHFTLDVEGYRDRRSEALEKLAQNMADRAIKSRRDVRLEPMNRHERKVIHMTLQDNDRVETHSAGTEPYRYVIITPTKRGKR